MDAQILAKYSQIQNKICPVLDNPFHLRVHVLTALDIGDNMSMYLTADLHFGESPHLLGRPFPNSRIMDNRLILNWNDQVQENTDQVICLGDFVHGNLNKFLHYFSQLRGKITMIPGEIDTLWIKQLYQQKPDLKKRLRIAPLIHVIKIQTDFSDEMATISHYPLLEWPHQTRIFFHGHTHTVNPYPKDYRNQVMNVGVDKCRFRPIDVWEAGNGMIEVDDDD
jgi:calcineurin-like phosphoesterase family protein